MLDKSVLKKIENKEITSRRQLYREVGRSRSLLKWLNDNNVLVPNKWTKERFVMVMKDKGITRAEDDWNMARLAQRFYGTWNKALEDIFGEVNQRRYSELTDEQLLATLTNFIKKYQRLPLREEFDGSSMEFPYYEAFTTRFGVNKWCEVLSLINHTKVYFSSKRGTGKVIIYNDILYLSHKEYLIGKYLEENNIAFEKEVPYGNSNHVFDFFLPEYNAYIEYYGMTTDEYKARIEEKRKHYDGRKVIEIFKHENTINKLALEVQRL